MLPALVALAAPLALGPAPGPPHDDPAPPRGLEVLWSVPLQDFGTSRDEFDALWTVWTGPERRRAQDASPAARRALALDRYGLFTDPLRGSDVPVAFAETVDGRWTLNCLGCHSARVAGAVVHGAGGNTFAFETLVRDVAALRRRRGEALDPQLEGMTIHPLGRTAGTTNAQGFSVVLAAFRDPDLGRASGPTPLGLALPESLPTDLDAPPLWHVRRKERLYLDGYVAKDPRVVMQFSLGLAMDAARIRGLEDEYGEIWRWIESLEPPPWPHPVDVDLAARGEEVYLGACARCHGTHGPDGRYPEESVPLDVVGTDPRRAGALPRAFREFIGRSWLGRGGATDVELDPEGYVAPPLDGLWATAPYLHNGSVPTLWHLLHPEERPAAWRRSAAPAYDPELVGLLVETAERAPRRADAAERRRWFDTSRPGMSADGHDFPARLGEGERRALLEYLKGL